MADCVWNMMAQAQKPDFVFRRNGRVHLNRRWRQFSRLLAAEVCASAVVMLDTPCSEVVWKVLATHFILQVPLHFPSRALPCAITFQQDSRGSCVTFRANPPVPYSRARQSEGNVLLDAWRWDPMGRTEMSVSSCEPALRNCPEGRKLQYSL